MPGLRCNAAFITYPTVFPLSSGQEWRFGQGKQWSRVQLPWFQCTVLAAVVWCWGWLHDICFKSSAIWGSKGAEIAFQNRSHRNALLPCECYATCPSPEGLYVQVSTLVTAVKNVANPSIYNDQPWSGDDSFGANLIGYCPVPSLDLVILSCHFLRYFWQDGWWSLHRSHPVSSWRSLQGKQNAHGLCPTPRNLIYI